MIFYEEKDLTIPSSRPERGKVKNDKEKGREQPNGNYHKGDESISYFCQKTATICISVYY